MKMSSDKFGTITHFIGSVLILLGLAGCGGSSSSFYSGDDTTTDTTTDTVLARLVIATDQATVQSDNSDSATITISALDTNNAAVDGATVSLSASEGLVTPASTTTDANGVATFTFSAGTQAATVTSLITATSGTVDSESIPVTIVGSSVSITSTTNNLVIGGTDTTTLTIKAMDASGDGVFAADVAISIDGTSDGSATLSNPANGTAAGGTTDGSGVWTVDLTGTSAGTVTVIVTALNESTTHSFNVESVAGSLLINSPTSGSTAPINTSTPVEIFVPAGITDVTLVSSLGVWTGSATGDGVRVWSGLTGPTTISDTLTSDVEGTATVQVSDTNNVLVNDSTRIIFVNTTVDTDTAISSIQASPATIAVSSSTSESSSEIIVTVTDTVSGSKIANARVTFGLSNTTGSGEYVSPPVAYTDSAGVARTYLYSGTAPSSGDGILVTAALDEALTGGPVTASTTVKVGGTAGSIDIGVSTKIASIDSDTGYELPIALQVTDSVGNPVPDTVVTLSLWPEKYALGYFFCEPEPTFNQTMVLANEDIDKDLFLDTAPINEDISGDGLMTPVNSAGGAIPSSVTTGDDGRALFTIKYNKANAGWIYDAIQASTEVQGSETVATKRFWLPYLESDFDGCYIYDSPFNEAWPQLTITSPAIATTEVAGSFLITVRLTEQDGVTGIPLKGILADLISVGSENVVAPSVSSFDITDTDGYAYFLYVAGDQAGTDVVSVSYTISTGSGDVVISDFISITVTEPAP